MSDDDDTPSVLVCPDCGLKLPPGAPGGFCPRCLMGSETLGRSTGGARLEFEPPTVEELDAAIPGIEITELIGRGGMGAVYKGRQARLGRTVAVKILPPIPNESESAAFDERFEREAQTMAKLSHPNIVAVYDFGETSDGQLYIVMEYVEGTNLATLIKSGEIKSSQALRWVPQMCEALEFAHENGVVHRDIKPSNVLVGAGGRGVKIADFGIARLAGEEGAEGRMTMTDVAVGSPDYVAPEQMEGGSKVDHRADIYSLGVLMYEMLTGQLPRGAWKPPSQRRPGEPVTKEFDPIVHRAMQSEPAERYQQVREVRTDVHGIRGGRADRSKALPWGWWIAGMGTVVLAVVAFAINRPEADPPPAGSAMGSTDTSASGDGARLYPTAPSKLGQVDSPRLARPEDPEAPVLSRAAMFTEKPTYSGDARWFNGPPPHADGEGAKYHYRLRPATNLTTSGPQNLVFGGLSLTADAGATVVLNSDQGGSSFTVNDFKIDGGHLHFPAGSRSLQGLVGIFADSTITAEAAGRKEYAAIGATLFGSGRISYRGLGGRRLELRGRNRDFSGGWHLRGNVVAKATASLGTGPITIFDGTLETGDTVRLAGQLEIYRPGKLVLAHYWEVESVRIDGETELEPGSYLWDDLVALGLGDVFKKGDGALTVRKVWSEEESKVLPFDPDPQAPVVEVIRAQKRGASFHHSGLWNGDPVPKVAPMRDGRLDGVAQRHYVVRPGGALRTPHGSMSTDRFGGLSLTIERGGSLHLCARTGSFVVHDLRLAGGQIVPDFDGHPGLDLRAGIGGQIHVGERSFIARTTKKLSYRNTTFVRVSASLSGDAPLVIDAPKLDYVEVESRQNEAFIGGWEVLSSTLKAVVPGALGSGPVTVKSGARLELLAPQSGGALVVADGGELVLEADCVFESAEMNGEAFAAGEHVIPGSSGKLVIR